MMVFLAFWDSIRRFEDSIHDFGSSIHVFEDSIHHFGSSSTL
ncbi:hypothetical protein [Lysinibacillus sp. NPDC056185]